MLSRIFPSYFFVDSENLYKSGTHAVPSQFPVNSHFIVQQKSDINLYRLINDAKEQTLPCISRHFTTIVMVSFASL